MSRYGLSRLQWLLREFRLSFSKLPRGLIIEQTQVYRQRCNLWIWPSDSNDIWIFFPAKHSVPISALCPIGYWDCPNGMAKLAVPKYQSPVTGPVLSPGDCGILHHLEIKLGTQACRTGCRVLHTWIFRARCRTDYLPRCKQCCRRNQEKLHGIGSIRGILCWKYNWSAIDPKPD